MLVAIANFVLSLAAVTTAMPTPGTALLARRNNYQALTPGCTNASLNNLTWTISNFDFHSSYVFTTPAHQNSWGYVSFNMTLGAIPDQVAVCSGISSQLSDFFYGDTQYNCTLVGTATNTLAPIRFTYSRPTNALTWSQTWMCNDQDPMWPSKFQAYGAVNLTLDCSDNTYFNDAWSSGEIYSDREVKCAPKTAIVAPFVTDAVA